MYNNKIICKLYLILLDFLKDICLIDVNVYVRLYGIKLFICFLREYKIFVLFQLSFFKVVQCFYVILVYIFCQLFDSDIGIKISEFRYCFNEQRIWQDKKINVQMNG